MIEPIVGLMGVDHPDHSITGFLSKTGRTFAYLG
jgi:hypothetical protein